MIPGNMRFVVKLPGGAVVCTVDTTLQADGLPGQSPENDGKITDSQRRYLTRLLINQGVEEKKVDARLKKFFKVESVADIPRSAASQYIDQLVAETKEAGSKE
jgi:hypothetical protein